MTDFAQARLAMVDCQIRPSDVTRYPIIQAMLAVPREEFVPADKRAVAYLGEHLDLGDGRVVLDPRVLAKMLESLEIGPRDLVLDLGCGLGYSSALMAQMSEAVVAVEENADMAAQATETLSAQGADNAVVVEAPLAAGAPSQGPFDVIILQGAIETLPAAIADQLKTGGRIAAIWLDGAVGKCQIGVKSGDVISWRRAFDATAPLLPGFEAEKAFVF